MSHWYEKELSTIYRWNDLENELSKYSYAKVEWYYLMLGIIKTTLVRRAHWFSLWVTNSFNQNIGVIRNVAKTFVTPGKDILAWFQWSLHLYMQRLVNGLTVTIEKWSHISVGS